MNFRVVWRERVLSDLHTRIFLAFEMGGYQDTLLAAADRIQHALNTAPETAGESRDDTERVLIESPLTVTYEVFPNQQVVLIYSLTVHQVR